MDIPVILCVDDEIIVLDSLKEQLKRLLNDNYRIEIAENAHEALEIVSELLEDNIEIPLVISDEIMPGLKGDELLAQIHVQSPKTLTILLTGQADADAVGRAVNKANLYRYIAKPWQEIDLNMTVKEGLRRYFQDKQIEEQNHTLQKLYQQAQLEITHRKQAEAALQKAHNQLEDRVKERTAELTQTNATLETRNAELDAFAHTVAHDLKAPLSIIIGLAELMMPSPNANQAIKDEDDESLIESLNLIYKTGYKMANIIDELLLLSSLRTEQVQMSRLHMKQIISQAKQRLTMIIKERKPTIILPDSWPNAIGYGPWVEEVWVNYMSNALKYGGNPPYIQLGATLQSNNIVKFWIQDNGAGLSSEEQAILFSEFTRFNQIKARGHGLGLSIVRRIVDKLGGTVGVESEVGQGSTFYFTLPTTN